MPEIQIEKIYRKHKSKNAKKGPERKRNIQL